MKSFLNTLLLVVVACLLLSYLGPALDDHSAEMEVAREEMAKQRQQDRFERSAQQACGENASYRLTHKQGEIICLTKRNRPTGRVAQL